MSAIARYLRVSTDKQSTENQEPDITRLMFAREGIANGPEGITYRETVSAAAKERPQFERMMEDARRGKISRLYIWSLDRFGRSMFQNLRDLTLLVDRYNVSVLSVRESWVEATGDPMTRKLLLAIFGWVAEHERERLRQRTNAGLDRARAAGKRLGRPPADIPDAIITSACQHRRMGRSWRNIHRAVCPSAPWSHTALAAVCLKRVPDLPRGKVGFPQRRR